MSTTDAGSGHFGLTDGEAAGGGHDDGEQGMGDLAPGHTHGPTEKQYFGIFFVLFAITALEVSTYWWHTEGRNARWMTTGVLLTLMVIKFAMIAGYFMHLKFDAHLLRRTFIFGLLIACAVYGVALTSMNIWTHSGDRFFDSLPPVVTTTTTTPAGP